MHDASSHVPKMDLLWWDCHKAAAAVAAEGRPQGPQIGGLRPHLGPAMLGTAMLETTGSSRSVTGMQAVQIMHGRYKKRL